MEDRWLFLVDIDTLGPWYFLPLPLPVSMEMMISGFRVIGPSRVDGRLDVEGRRTRVLKPVGVSGLLGIGDEVGSRELPVRYSRVRVRVSAHLLP
jgi:hypothetical protein